MKNENAVGVSIFLLLINNKTAACTRMFSYLSQGREKYENSSCHVSCSTYYYRTHNMMCSVVLLDDFVKFRTSTVRVMCTEHAI